MATPSPCSTRLAISAGRTAVPPAPTPTKTPFFSRPKFGPTATRPRLSAPIPAGGKPPLRSASPTPPPPDPRGPDRLDAGGADFVLKLRGGEGTRIVLRVGCGPPAGESWNVRRYYRALRASRHALRRASGCAASLDASNAVFNELSRRSVADLYILMTDTPHGPYPYAGIPWFSAVFGRDGIITALLTLWADPTIAKGVLRFLAAEQATSVEPESDAEPGKILHEMRKGEMARLGEVPFARYYGSLDATPLFVMLAGDDFPRPRDLDPIGQVYPHIKTAMQLLDTLRQPR